MAVGSGGEVAFHRSDLPPALGPVGAMGLWAAIGAGFGAIARNQIAVVAIGFIWILMLKTVGSGLVNLRRRPFLPGQTVHAMAQTPEAIDLLGVVPATLLRALYAQCSSPGRS
jgi:hypothetical protein